MTNVVPSSSDLVRRLERLEGESRRWRMLALLLFVLLASVVFVAAGPVDLPVPELLRARTIEAQRVLLRDADGTVRARIGFADGGAKLTFYDAHGKVVGETAIRPGYQALGE